MDWSPAWAAELAELTQENLELQHMVDVLKGALAASDIAALEYAPWMAGLTPAGRFLVGALIKACPRTLAYDELRRVLPSRGHPDDRLNTSVHTIAKFVRARLGPDCVITEYGLGYRMSRAFRDRLLKQPAEAP